MTHNEFDFYMDLIRPVFQFFMKIDMQTTPNSRVANLELDEKWYLDSYHAPENQETENA